MANLVRYYFRKLGANFVDFKLDYPSNNLSLIGSDVVYVGSSGVDRVYVAKGVKFTFNNSGTGTDEIYLDGSFADYSLTAIGTSTLLLTSTAKANTSITLASEDKVFFSDGSSGVKSLITYAAARIGTPSTPPPTLNTTENSLTLPSTSNLDSILRAYTKDPAGVVFAQPHAGVEFILTGHNGVDKVYVSKGGKVNANNLGTGVDLIYLTGNKNEYSPTAVGTSVLVLTKGTERVTLASEDRVIFADGSTLVKAAITAASGANWQALSLDSNTRTPGLSVQLDLDIASASNDYSKTVNAAAATTGISIAPNAALLSSGGNIASIKLTLGGANWDTTSDKLLLNAAAAAGGTATTVALTANSSTPDASEISIGGIAYLRYSYDATSKLLTITPSFGNTLASADAENILSAIQFQNSAASTTQGVRTIAVVINNGSDGPVSNITLNVDTLAPAMPTLALGAGVSGGATAAEATAATGVVSVLAESGSTVLLTFSDSASLVHTLVKTLTGNGSAQSVQLDSTDIGTGPASLQDGSITISATATDAAGNTSSAGTASFTLDTAIASPILALGSGVADGASRAEALSGLGVVTVIAEEDSTVLVTFTDSADSSRSVVKAVFGIGQEGSVRLSSADLGTGSTQLGDHTITVTAVASDAAGNVSTISNTSFTLDTTPPAVPTLTLAANAVGGATLAEATAATGVVMVNTDAGSTVVVYFANHPIPVPIVLRTLVGTGSALALTLDSSDIGIGNLLHEGRITVTAVASDAAGNTSRFTTSFTLDTTVPLAPTLALGSGVADGATLAEAIANSGAVTIHAELGSNVAVTLSDSASHSVIKQITGTGSAQVVTLNSSDIGMGADSLQDGRITVSASVTDAAGNTSTAASSSFMLDTLPPVIGTRSLAVNENTQAVGTATISNADTVSWALEGSGDDNALFAIDPTSGAITWLAANGRNFEAATQSAANSNSYTLSVSATDAAGNKSTQAISVQLLDVNEAPVNVLPAALAANEDTPLAITGISVSDVDAGANGIASMQLSVVNGTLSVMADAAAGGLAAASISGNNSNSLTLTGNQAAINATLASLIYQGRLNFHGTDTLTVQTSDGGLLVNNRLDSVSISVAPVNDAPTFSGIPAGTEDIINALPAALADFTVNDVDSADTMLFVTLSPSNGSIEGFTDGTINGLTVHQIGGMVHLSGTAAIINAALAAATFTASTAGTASIGLRVSDASLDDTAADTSTSASYRFNAVNTPVLVIASGQDAYINNAETGVDVEFILGSLASNDTVQLMLDGNAIGGVHTVSAAEASTRKASIRIAKGDLGAEGSKSISAEVSQGAATPTPTNNTLSLTLDTTAPNTPTLSPGPGPGLADGATSAEATASSGVLVVNAEAASTVAVTFADSTGHSVIKMLTSSGTAQAVTLNSADLGSGSASLQDGSIRVSATATDLAGNTSTAGSSSFTLDTSAPAAPALELGSGVLGGATAAEATANSGVLSVHAESGSTLLITFADSASHTLIKTLIGSGSAQAVTLDGSDIALGTASLLDGTISVSATASDAAGNTSPAGSSSFTLDTEVASPVVELGAGVVGGASAAEATASSGVVTVNAESNSTVLLTFSDSASHMLIKTVIGTGSAAGVTLDSTDLGSGTASLQDGSIMVSASATDTAGNVSMAGSNSFTLDTSAPAAPAWALATGVDSGATAAEATAASGVVSVNAEPGSSVAVTFTDSASPAHSLVKTVISTGTAQGVTLDSANLGFGIASLQDGSITVSASATDAAGNTSAPGRGSFTLDTSAPAAPALALATGVDGGATAAEATASSGVVTVNAESNSTVLLTFSDSASHMLIKTLIGTGSAAGVTLDSTDLGSGTASLQDGSITVSASATDFAGNVSLAGSSSFTLDTAKPDPPTLARGMGVTRDATLVEAQAGAVTVNAELGSSVAVTFSDSSNHSVIKLLTSSGSALAVTLDSSDIGSGASQLQDGSITVTATATDAAGNVSNAGSNSSFTLDTHAPAAPVLAQGSGVSDGATAAEATAGSGVVTVNAELGSSVAVTFTDSNSHSVIKMLTGSGSALAVTLDSSDIGSDTAMLQDGRISVSATATDAAGNTSLAGSGSFTLDSTAPEAPSVELRTGIFSGATAAEATAPNGVLTVTAESGSTVLVTFGERLNGSDIAASAHSVVKTMIGTGSAQSVALDSSDIGSGAGQLQDGYISIIATATDAAGNTSGWGGDAFLLDTQAPTTPSFSTHARITDEPTAGVLTLDADLKIVNIGDENEELKIVRNSDGSYNIYVQGEPTPELDHVSLQAVIATISELNSSVIYNDGILSLLENLTTPGRQMLASVTAEGGSTKIITFTDSLNHSVSKTVVGLGSNAVRAVNVSLLPSDWGTGVNQLTDGNIGVSVLSTDIAGNVSMASSGSFTLDTRAPAAPVFTPGSGVAGGATAAEATASTGVVSVNGESGSSLAVTFSDGSNHSVIKLLTGTGAALAVTLDSSDLGTGTASLLDGTIRVSASATDAAGNTSTAGTGSFTLDTSAPAAPVLTLATGVAGGASAAEALAGAVTVNAELGSRVAVTFTDSASHSVIKLLTGTGSALAVVLNSTDLGNGAARLQDGRITVSATATDAAGNLGSAGSSSFDLDAVPPGVPTLQLGSGVADVANLAEATAASGVVTVIADAGSSLAITFTDSAAHSVIKLLTGTGLALPVTLDAADLGSGSSQLNDGNIRVTVVAMDVAGNANTVVDNFRLDSTPPAAPSLTLGAGVADGASAAEATASSGVVFFTAERGSSLRVVLTGPNGTLSKDISGADTEYPGILGADSGGGGGSRMVRHLDDTIDQLGYFNNTLLARYLNIEDALARIVYITPAQIATIRAIPAPGRVELTAADLGILGDGTVTLSATAIDAAGTVSVASTGSFFLDTAPPPTPALVLGMGVSNGATELEAIASSGVVTVNAESGSSVVITFTDSVQHRVAKTLLGDGSAQAVTLDSSDLGPASNQLISGSISISAVATDVAGNHSSAGNTSFDLFANPILLGAGVANGATAVEATASSGVVTLAVASGNTVLLTFTDSAMPTAHSLVRTLTGSGGLLPVTLTSSELGTSAGQLKDGAIRVSATVTDPVNSTSYSSSFILDTEPPATPILNAPVNSNPLRQEWVDKIDDQYAVTRVSNGTYSIFSKYSEDPLEKNLTFNAMANYLSFQTAYGLDVIVYGGVTGSGEYSGLAEPLLRALPIAGTTSPTLQVESGSTVLVTLTDTSNHSLIKTITGMGVDAANAVPIKLNASDLGTDVGHLQNGLIQVSLFTMDEAGNASSTVTSSFTLDTVVPTAFVPSRSGLQLKSSSHQYASLPSAAVAVPSAYLSGQLTLEAWVFASGNPSDGTHLLDLASSGNMNNIVLGFTNAGKLYFEAFSGSTSLGQKVTSNAFPTDSWHHVAVTVATGNTVTLYVDGASVYTGTLSGTIPTTTRSSSYVGHSNTAGAPDFNGIVSDVAVFEYSLPADQIRQQMAGLFSNSQFTGYYPFTTSSRTVSKAFLNGSRDPEATLTNSPVFTNPLLTFSADTGSVGDYITSTAAQTITTKLEGTLGAGEKIYGSVDDGSTWTDLSSFVSGSNVNWTGVTLLSGTHHLQMGVQDAAGNFGPLLIQQYQVM